MLVLMEGPGRVRRIELHKQRTLVGRDPACDVRLDDPHVSRTHAALHRRGDAVYVTDLGSSGGTFVGGAAVTTPRELRPGDVVTFASVLARFEPAGTGEETLVGLEPAGDPPRVHPSPVNPPRVYRPREDAATRTRARWLSLTGALVLAEGLAIAFLVGRPGGAGLTRSGPHLAGVPAGLLGLALAGAGCLLLLTGLGLHIAASTRKRQAARR